MFVASAITNFTVQDLFLSSSCFCIHLKTERFSSDLLMFVDDYLCYKNGRTQIILLTYNLHAYVFSLLITFQDRFTY